MKKKGGYYDVALVEFLLEVVDDVGARGHVWRDEDVAPIIGPSGIAVVVVRQRCFFLRPLRFFPHSDSTTTAATAISRRRRRIYLVVSFGELCVKLSSVVYFSGDFGSVDSCFVNRDKNMEME